MCWKDDKMLFIVVVLVINSIGLFYCSVSNFQYKLFL